MDGWCWLPRSWVDLRFPIWDTALSSKKREGAEMREGGEEEAREVRREQEGGIGRVRE